MNRREALQAIGGWGFALGLGLGLAGLASASARDRFAPTHPNILFLALDDLNDWVGCLGNHQARTPHIDALAGRGVLFSNAHCATPACSPSRAAVMTGRAPWTTGVYDNTQARDPRLPSIATAFGRAGYTTGLAGKVYHGGVIPPGPPSVDFVGPGPNNSGTDPDPANHFRWGPMNAKTGVDEAVVAWAEGQLAVIKGREPWFLGVGLVRPHLSWFCPQRFFDLHPLNGIELPEPGSLDDCPAIAREFALAHAFGVHIPDRQAWREAVRAYLACCSYADDCVGRIVQAAPSDTIIVLWSDNGMHLGEKEHCSKYTLWEPSTHVPLVVSGPDIEPGVCKEAVSLLDLFPTLCDLAHVNPPPGLDGLSLEPLLHEPARKTNRVAVTCQLRGNFAARDARWRYIRYMNGSEELYDHQHDPGEYHNLAQDPAHTDVKQRLRARLPKHSAPDAARDKQNRRWERIKQKYPRVFP